MTKNLKKI
jgi:hypothetical protein